MVLATLGALVPAAGARAAEPEADPAPTEVPDEGAPVPVDTGPSNDGAAGVQREGERAAEAEPERPSALPFALGLGAGYGFRPHPDGRNHGGTAHLYGDIPLAFGFGVRPEVLGFAYGPSLDVERPLAHPMAAASLVYAFDDTDAVAVVGVGGFVGLPLDLGREDAAAASPLGAPLSAGVLLSLGLRFPLVPGVRVEAGIRVPFALVEPPPPEGVDPSGDLHTQIALTGAIVLSPDALSAFIER